MESGGLTMPLSVIGMAREWRRPIDKATQGSGRQRQLYSRLVTILALAYGGMGVVNAGRAVQSYWNVALLQGWEPSLSPWVLLGLSLVWAAVFLAAGWALWRRRGWGRWLAVRLPPIYGFYSAGTILLWTRSPYARGRWLLVAVAWAVASLLVGWILSRAGIRAQFGNQKV
jgi:hypothetical protein